MANGNDPVNLTRHEWQELLLLVQEIRHDVKEINEGRPDCKLRIDTCEKQIGSLNELVSQAKGGWKLIIGIATISSLLSTGLTIIISKL